MAANYKCTAIGCYSYNSPSTNADIRKLQGLINRFSTEFGFTPIAVDGIVGKGSFAALLWTLQALSIAGGTFGPTATEWFAALNKPEDVFVPGVMPALIFVLEQSATASNLPAVAPSTSATPNQIPRPTGSGGTAVLTQIQQIKPSTQGSIFDSVRDLPTWAKWGALFAALGTGAYVFTKAKKSKALSPG